MSTTFVIYPCYGCVVRLSLFLITMNVFDMTCIFYYKRSHCSSHRGCQIITTFIFTKILKLLLPTKKDSFEYKQYIIFVVIFTNIRVLFKPSFGWFLVKCAFYRQFSDFRDFKVENLVTYFLTRISIFYIAGGHFVNFKVF